MKIITITLLLLSSLLMLQSCSQQSMNKQKISAEALSKWKTLDKGKKTVSGDELIIEEIEGSDGYFLISPQSYDGDIMLNYKVKAISESSVLIVLLHASDMGETNILSLPPKETQGMGLWTWRTELEHYNLTFNNSSHGNKPFFFKNLTPNKRGFYQNATQNIMEAGKWYDVEIGKKGKRLWFSLNNELIFEQEDCRPLKHGHLMFRISGTTGENTILAKASIKDLIISH